MIPPGGLVGQVSAINESQCGDQVTRFDLGAGVQMKSGDDSRAGARDGCLHLHGLDHGNALTRLDLIARINVDMNDARDRRREMRRIARFSLRTGYR
jgi:hypothetical protein